MTTLIFPGNSYKEITSTLLNSSSTETAGILLASTAQHTSGNRLIIREALFPTEEEYIERSAFVACLNPSFVAHVAKRALVEHLSIVFVHTHVGPGQAEFSAIDTEGEIALRDFLQVRLGEVREHLSLVLTKAGCACRHLGGGKAVRVLRVGEIVEEVYAPESISNTDNTYDRQIRALGKPGQQSIQRTTVGIVGLGGTGSLVAEYLSHLGVRHFCLVDPDTIEFTNLNRLVGATRRDVGKNKVDVTRRTIRRIQPDAKVKVIKGSVNNAQVALELAHRVDFLFSCTDSQGSRAILNQIAYQYVIPVIDMGVVIAANQDGIQSITGRVQMLSPGLACLTCTNLLDSRAVRFDLMTEWERQADSYFVGSKEPQPAVISFNATVSSLSTSMFLAAVTRLPMQIRHQIYDAIRGQVRAAEASPDPFCIVCSPQGALARGDSWPLPARYA